MTTMRGRYRVSIFAQGVEAGQKARIKAAVEELWTLESWAEGIIERGAFGPGARVKPGASYVAGYGTRMVAPQEVYGLTERLAAAVYRANRWQYCAVYISLALVVEDITVNPDQFGQLKAKYQ